MFPLKGSNTFIYLLATCVFYKNTFCFNGEDFLILYKHPQMRTSIFSVLILLVTAPCSFAQHARVKEYKTPFAGSVVLRDVDDKYNAQVFNLQEPGVANSRELEQLRALKKQTTENFPLRKSAQANKTTSSVPKPTLGINFVADSLSGIPPDNYSAISKGDTIVNVMNSNITVHNANTGAYVTRKGLQAFSAVVGLNGVNDFRYDPKVAYDPVADRFICVILNGTVQYNYIIIAFSQTNDPTGGWNFYKFYGDYTANNTWFDYPAISITQNEFFLTGNKVMDDSSWQAGFTKSVIYQIRKQDGYNGAASLTYRIWDSIQYNNHYLRCLYPVNPGDALAGPGQYFISNYDFAPLNDTCFMIQVPDTIGSLDTNLSVIPLVSTLSYGMPPDARQPDTSLSLATNDNRVLGGFIEGNEIQFVCTSVNPLNGASAVYLGKISNVNTTPSMTGQIFSIDTLDFGYPNISYLGNSGGNNQSVISFEYSGPRTFPGFGAILFDGTGFSDMLNIKSGNVNIHKISGKEQRWGDYSGSQPDWNTTGVVWVEGIYGRKDVTSDASYGDYMAQLLAPWKVGIPLLQKPTVSPSAVFPNPAWEIVSYEFTVEKEQAFSFMIYDQQGRVVDKLLDRFCADGKNVIQFNIAPLAPGTYFLKAMGNKGENIMVRTFMRR
jgi:hypothetical protein